MRILMLTNEVSTTNGWATTGFYLLKGLRSKYETRVVSAKEHLKKSVDWYYDVLALWQDYRRVISLLDGFNPDVILCIVEPMFHLGVLLKKRYKSRLIMIGYGTYIYYPFIGRGVKSLYNRLFFREVDALCVISRFTREKVKEWLKDMKKVRVVPLGVDVKEYRPVEVEKEKSFVFVGAQKPRKGFQFLVPAFKRLLETHPDLRLYVVGEPTRFGMEVVKKWNAERSVIFTGKVSHEELLSYYSRSLAHILPSVNTDDAFEGFGLVHLEANACGIPSLGSLGTANEEVIVDGYSGFLCPQGDVDCIYQRMKQMVEDVSLVKELGLNALKHAKTFSWDRTIKGIEATWKDWDLGDVDSVIDSLS